MSYPYPQDRNRDRREKGEQPYKAAREAFAETEANLQTEAEAFGEARAADDRAAAERLKEEVIDSMRAVGDERAEHAKP